VHFAMLFKANNSLELQRKFCDSRECAWPTFCYDSIAREPLCTQVCRRTENTCNVDCAASESNSLFD